MTGMLNTAPQWSHARGSAVAPSPWQATYVANTEVRGTIATTNRPAVNTGRSLNTSWPLLAHASSVGQVDVEHLAVAQAGHLDADVALIERVSGRLIDVDTDSGLAGQFEVVAVFAVFGVERRIAKGSQSWGCRKRCTACCGWGTGWRVSTCQGGTPRRRCPSSGCCCCR